MEEYTVTRKIGDGAQGVVYEVMHNTTKQHYAMKAICCSDQEQVNLALKEIKVLLQLRHPHIVSYVDFFLVFNNAKLRHEFAAKAEQHGKTAATSKDALNDSLHLRSLSNSDISPDARKPVRRPANLPPLQGGQGVSPAKENHNLIPTSLLSQATRGTGAHSAGVDGVPGGMWLGKEEIAVCLVMELCSNGDMQGLIRDARQKMMETGKHPSTEAQILSWAEQGAAALQFIHEKGFLHRDLKPTNIFFDEYRDIKVGDFGLAATVGLGRQSAVGTPYYLAPERMLQQRYDSKIDIWGLGVVLLELLTLREQPINSMVLENPQIGETAVKKITELGFSAKLATLVRDMLHRMPADRPTATAILHRLAGMTSTSPHLGMSTSLFAGMSCPKLSEALCDVCEVEMASIMCPSCKAAFCKDCDRARHKHHTRQSHDRTSLSSLMNSTTGVTNTSGAMQHTLSSSRGTSPGTHSDQTRNSTQNGTVMPPSGNISRTLPREREMNGRTFARFQLAMPGNSLSMSDFSMTQSVLARRDGSANASGTAAAGGSMESVLRVPLDAGTLQEAVKMAESMPHVRKIKVSSNTTHSQPLVLTCRLPDGIKIIGDSPPPVLEVGDSPFALSCKSGKGVVENFIIRHVGRCRTTLRSLDANGATGTTVTSTAEGGKKPSRPTAVSITGGEWRLHKCRISCVDGSGVTVGGSKIPSASSTGSTMAAGSARNACNGARAPAIVKINVQEEEEEEMTKMVEPMVTKCTFIDVTAAGIVLMEKARGLYESNTFSGCGFAAFLLKKESSPRIRANHITDGAEAGIFCQDASGVMEFNVIAQNAGCGVVIKGPSAAPIFRKNRVLSNGQAGVFCCDRAAPFVTDNEVRQNNKAGVLIKTKASPKVTRNVIESGKEAGIYVFEGGSGIIEENKVRGNHNAGLLVTTEGNPHVIKNVLTKNAYEGVWVCNQGGGTFCDNDLRGNKKGPKDVSKDCNVTWVGNVEE